MKSLMTALCILFIATVTHAQKYVPEIKENTVINADATAESGTFPVMFTFGKMASGVNLMWSVAGYGDGTFEMSKNAVENGNGVSAGQPNLGVTKLDDKTILFISRKAYQELKSTNSFTYGGLKFGLDATDQESFVLMNKQLDVIHLKSEDGKVKLTILNNPLIPITLQTRGLDTDILVTEIK